MDRYSSTEERKYFHNVLRGGWDAERLAGGHGDGGPGRGCDVILLVDELRPSPVLERLAHWDHSTGATSQEEIIEAVDEEELEEAADEAAAVI